MNQQSWLIYSFQAVQAGPSKKKIHPWRPQRPSTSHTVQQDKGVRIVLRHRACAQIPQAVQGQEALAPGILSCGDRKTWYPQVIRHYRKSPNFMGKLGKITIFQGKTWKNHNFSWENYGTSPFFMGKLTKIKWPWLQ